MPTYDAYVEELAFETRRDVDTAISNSGHNEFLTNPAERDFFAEKIWAAAKFDGRYNVISRKDFDTICIDEDRKLADEFAMQKLDDDLDRGCL